jgi:hypothetical protein
MYQSSPAGAPTSTARRVTGTHLQIGGPVGWCAKYRCDSAVARVCSREQRRSGPTSHGKSSRETLETGRPAKGRGRTRGEEHAPGDGVVDEEDMWKCLLDIENARAKMEVVFAVAVLGLELLEDPLGVSEINRSCAVDWAARLGAATSTAASPPSAGAAGPDHQKLSGRRRGER